MIKRIICLLIALVALVSCGTEGKPYRIGIDPSWYPFNLQGKESNVFAFSGELLEAISYDEGMVFERIRMDWDNLTLGLREKKYEGILSSMTPRISLETTYAFSEPFLHTGPVLVVQAKAKINAMSQMRGKQIAVESLSDEALVAEQFPGVNIQHYTSVSEGLEELIAGQVDGVLINYIQATSYIRDLYHGQVKIATPPLDDEGLRLVTLTGEDEELIAVFNRGLEKLQRSGKLDKLLKKWELY